MRILEAHVSNYSDHSGVREAKINETDLGTGRNALHYLSYMANADMIQLLGATDQLKMNILDARDRTCMHYAAIQGKSSLINTLFLLFKSYGGKFKRAEIDPNYKELSKRKGTVVNDLEELNAQIEMAEKDEDEPEEVEMDEEIEEKS